MINFYLARLQKRLENNQNLQLYLDITVPYSLRDEVRDRWNESHPDNQLR